MNIRRYLIAAVLPVLACSKPAPPTIAPVSASIAQLTAEGIDLSVALNVTNPNSIDLSAQGMTAHVVLNQTIDMGTVTSSQGISLPAAKTTPMTVPLSVRWTSLAAVAGLAQTSGDVPYSVDGTVTMGGTLVNVAIPFHLDGKVTHAQLVNATLRSIPGLPGLPSLR
jgi:LEA14-like dessication related protein